MEQAIIITKACSKCKEVKSLEKFADSKIHRYKKYPSCLDCRKKYWMENKNRLNSTRNAIGKVDEAKLREREKRNKGGRRKKAIRGRDEMKDYYVRNLLKKMGIPYNQMTSEMIELKRLHLTANRLSKKLINQIK